MEEKVIFEVDVTSLSKAVLQAQADLDMYNTALKDSIELNGKFSEETVQAKAAVDAQSKAVKQAEGSLVRLTQAEKALGGNLNQLIKTYDATANSTDNNRKVRNALTAAYEKASVVERTKMLPTLKALNEEINKQSLAVSNTKDNVGNYANSIIDGFGGGQFTGAIGNIGAVGKGVLGIATNLGTLRTALLTSGIGALALAVAGVATYFKAFEDGSELLERKLSGLKGAADVVISQFGLMGKSIVDSIGEATKKSFADNAKSIGVSIKDGLLAQAIGVKDTYLALGKVISTFGKDGAAELQDAILRSVSFGTVSRKAIEDTAEAAAKAFKQAEEFTRQIQVLAEAEREYGLVVSKNSIEVDRLRIAARSRGADFETQLQLLAEAGRLEEINIGIERRNAEERLRIVKAQTDIKRKQGLVTEKVTQDEFDAQKKLDEVRRSSILLTEKINNQIDAVLVARAAENTKQIEDFSAVVNKALIKDAETTAGEFVKIQDGSIEALREHIKRKNAEYQKGVADELQIEKDKEQSKAQLLTASFAAAAGVISSISDILNAEFDAQTQQLNEALESGTISKEKYAAETTELKKKQFEQNKAIALSSAILQGINATLAAYTSGSAIPIVGAVTGPVFAALAAAFAAVQVGLIAAKPMPKFARGVIGLDGEGTETSDSIPANLSKGESVMTAKATKVYHRQLAEMEWSVGNRPNYQFGKGRFASGYIPIPNISTDGGFTAREAMRGSDMNAMIKEAVRSGFAAAPATKLSIVELESKQKSRNRSVKISEL